MGHGHMGRIILILEEKITGELIDYGGGSQFCVFFLWILNIQMEICKL